MLERLEAALTLMLPGPDGTPGAAGTTPKVTTTSEVTAELGRLAGVGAAGPPANRGAWRGASQIETRADEDKNIAKGPTGLVIEEIAGERGEGAAKDEDESGVSYVVDEDGH